MTNVHPSTWSSQQVEEWLIRNQFNDSVDILCQQNQIDGQHLLNLEQSEILHLTNNQNLYYQIENLKENSLSKICRSTAMNSISRPQEQRRLSQTSQSMSLLLEPPTFVESFHDPIEDRPDSTCCLFVSIRSDKKKTFFAFLLALSTVFFCSFIITIVDERLPDPKDYPPLPDLILDNIQQIPWAFAVTEKLILLEISVLAIIVLLHRYRMIILRRLFVIAAALYFLRSVTMLVTSLPVATQLTDCQPKDFVTIGVRLKKATLIFVGQGMSSFGVKTCGDYLYSGHTCTLVLATHFINEYSPRSYHLLHFLSWIAGLTGMFFILAGHQHYSIDILIAWVLTSRLFVYYHTLANNRTYLRCDTMRMRIWFPFFSYFEENVNTAIPNEYCIPEFLTEARAMLKTWLDTIRYSVYWLILFLFIIITYSISFTRNGNFSLLIER